MKIRYGIITLNQFDWVVDKHLPSIDWSQIDAVHLHLSNSLGLTYHGVQQSWWDVVQSIEPRVKSMLVTETPENLGVAPGWNLLCQTAFNDGCDAIIIANDDIILESDTISRVVQALNENSFVCYGAAGHNAFSFFAITRGLYEQVGEFDNQFWPAYYEDNDYAYRMKLLGLEMCYLDGSSFYHAGSATLGKYSEEEKAIHHHNFRKNTDYYIQKWGGLPNHEAYKTPFGGQ
jgi:GT2 family glycosyltransferase